MGHNIIAIVIRGEFQEEKATAFDLRPVPLDFNLTLFHIDHYYSACWQYMLRTEGFLELTFKNGIFPNQIAIAEIVKRITQTEEPEYAIIFTDYFGHTEDEDASVFRGAKNADKTIFMINPALKHLGVAAKKPLNEFETIGLENIRSQPDYLAKYKDLAEELGV